MPILSKPQTSKTSLVAQRWIQVPMQEMQVWSVGQENPLEKEMATSFSILVWKIPSAGEPGSYSLWDHKESDKTEQLNTPTSRMDRP